MKKTHFHILSALFALSMVGCIAVQASDEFEFEVMDAGSRNDMSDDVLRADSANQARIERGVVVPLPRTVRKGAVNYVIEHRTWAPADQDPFDDFLGFDSGGLKIGLGVIYGVTDNSDVMLYRLNGTVEDFDSYELRGRFQWLNESEHGLDAAILLGPTVFVVKDDDDAMGVFSALMLGKSLFGRLYATTGILYHDNSSAELKTADDEEESAAVFGSFNFRVNDGMFLVGDYSVPVQGYEAESGAWAAGLKYVTHGHSFSFVASNSQYMGLDGLAAGSSKDTSDVLLGFAITREIK